MKQLLHVFFDFDWIIANTEDIYIQTRCDILTDEWKQYCKLNYINSTDVENYNQFKKWISLHDNSLENVRLVRKRIFDKYINESKIQLVADVIQIIGHFSEKYPLSIVSNSHPDLVKQILKSHTIDHLFSNVYWLIWERVAKPSPDIYLNALKELNISNNEVITIEDSISWIRSAIDAWIACYWVSRSQIVQVFCEENGVKYFSNMKSFLLYLT